MDEKQIEDGEFTEVNDEVEAKEDEIVTHPDAPKAKMGLQGFLSAITAAVKGEQITPAQARELRQNMGISQSFFTRNRNADANKAKAKRKAQKAARKVTRGSTKGQKSTKGARYRMNK